MDPRIARVEDLLCDESFQHYCRGEDPAAILFWETWTRDNPDQLALVAEAKRMFEMLNLGQGNRLEQRAALKDAMAHQSLFKEQVLNRQETTHGSRAKLIKFPGRTLLKYAAAILILVTAGAFTYILYGRKTTRELTEYEYSTGAQERKTIMLPDSSIIMLNENSHLQVSRDFDGQHRQVAITGEAFFDIKHDPNFPFLVNTPQYSIRVLGTTFNVRSYPGRNSTETTLLTGKIEILPGTDRNAEPKVVLKPNEKFILDPYERTQGQPESPVALGKGKVVTPVMDTSTHHLAETSWARRKMTINDKTLAGIADELQAWYGIKIRFTGEAVKSYRYTATFDDETIFSVLRYLQQSYPFTYSIEDDCIVIAGTE